MRLAVLIHYDCKIPRQMIERGIRKILQQEKPKVLLYEQNKSLSRGVQQTIQQLEITMLRTLELRQEGSWRTHFMNWVLSLNDQDLLIRKCDKAVVFWDDTPEVKKLLNTIKQAGKAPLIVKLSKTT